MFELAPRKVQLQIEESLTKTMQDLATQSAGLEGLQDGRRPHDGHGPQGGFDPGAAGDERISC
jgi:hypothetical protein